MYHRTSRTPPDSFIVVGVPVLQLVTSVAGERAAARRRAASPE